MTIILVMLIHDLTDLFVSDLFAKLGKRVFNILLIDLSWALNVKSIEHCSNFILGTKLSYVHCGR